MPEGNEVPQISTSRGIGGETLNGSSQPEISGSDGHNNTPDIEDSARDAAIEQLEGGPPADVLPEFAQENNTGLGVTNTVGNSENGSVQEELAQENPDVVSEVNEPSLESSKDTTSQNQVSEETPLTQEAKDLLEKMNDSNSAPAFMTSNLKKIAQENGIQVTGDMSPNQVIEVLRQKQNSTQNESLTTQSKNTTTVTNSEGQMGGQSQTFPTESAPRSDSDEAISDTPQVETNSRFGIDNIDDLSPMEKEHELAGKLQENADRINPLQAKKDAGTITPEEQTRLDQYIKLNKELYAAGNELNPEFTPGPEGAGMPIETAAPGEEPPEPTPEEKARLEAEKRDREIQAIKEKIKSGAATPEERNRLNQLKIERGAQDRLKALEEKELSDEPLTGEEMRELAKLREKSEEPEDIVTDTPEQALEKLSQELDTDYQTALEKMARGEDATEEVINFNKKLAEAMGYTITKQDEQDAREQVKGILNPERKNSPESAKMRHIKEKLTELARYELQLQNQAKIINEMNKNEKDLKQKVNDAESAYVNASNPDQKQQNLQIFRRESVRLGNYQEAIKTQKSLGRDILVKRRQARGYIHRKLGTHGFLYNMGFGAGTAVMEAGIGIANSYDTLFDFA